MLHSLRRIYGPNTSDEADPAPRRRPWRSAGLATALLVAVVAALVAAPGAGAVGFQSAGTFTDPAMNFPTGVAVDPSSGNVYVSNMYSEAGFPNPGTVLRFDAEGAPLSPATMGTGFYAGVAVEQGGDHTVYGNDWEFNGAFGGTPHLEAFTSAGAPVGAPFPLEVDASLAQLGSDSAGNIYLPDLATNTVKKYTGGAAPGSPEEFACAGTDCEGIALNAPRSVAVDPDGNVYVADTENHRVVKFSEDGSFDSVIYAGAAESLAIDSVEEMILVAGNDGELGQHVTALDYSGATIGEIPIEEFTGTAFLRLAVNPSSGTVYVAEFQGATSQVAMFEILPSPTATTGSASSVSGGSATLNGTVNPNGVISENCQFEYTDDADFQANAWANAESAACSPQPFNESTDVAVSANVTGLASNTTYDYRVVESTQAGIAEGDSVQFTTPTPPTATTGGAANITQHSATLSGTTNPQGAATTSCRIEWGPAAGNYSTGQAPCSPDPGSSAANTAVSASATGLAANTTYHFRVVEATAGGTVDGNDATFTTLADTCQNNSALCPPSGGGGGTPGGGGTGGGGTTEDKAAYGKCVAAANKTFKKALKKAKSKHGKARATAIKAAKKKKGKLVNSCKLRYL